MPSAVAPNVQTFRRDLTLVRQGKPLRSMNRDFQIRFTAGLLILLTTAAVVLAWINFQKEPEFLIPSDGVWWIEHNGSLLASRVDLSGPGARAGVKERD